MRLSTNELRVRASQFAKKWAEAFYEKGETQTFYNEFFAIFGVERRVVARYEEHVKKLNDKTGFIDLFWPKVLLVEQKSAGRDLKKAADQAGEYFDALKDADKPRYQLVCDFQNFELLDRDTREVSSFTLAELPAKIEQFNFIRGLERRAFKDQDPVNIKASELMGDIHDALEQSGYKGHDLERFLVRLVFMLFADDTGIFDPRDILLDLIESRTNVDGSDVGSWLDRLFQVLNTPEDTRNKNLDEDLNKFPYINGDLFAERLPTTDFTAAMRETLLEACRFNWSSHYTTEKNILKVIGPLFLDELRAEFERIKALKRGRAGELEAFRRRLGTLTFLDPACGCGNFLIISYRELRMLEMDVLRAINPEGQKDIGIVTISELDVDQFYGIEFEEFPARIAEVAMWMMDHIMNNLLSVEFGQTFIRIPLRKSPHIKHADALELDWNTLLPAHQCSYVLGNPPFIGQSYQSPIQRTQMARVIGHKSGKAGSLDYVGAWFLKAGAYVQNGRAKIAFVSTNSITQGEQVAQLWPLLFDRYKLEIAFAHRTFNWGSEARGVAHVHVVIIGLTRADMEPAEKRLFTYENIKGEPVESRHAALAAYLVDATNLGNKHVVVLDSKTPLNDAPVLSRGNQPTDAGNYIFNDLEKAAFIASEPNAKALFRPFIGSLEFLNNISRWILLLRDIPPETIKGLPRVRERIQRVRAFRLASKKEATRRFADYPMSLEGSIVPTSPFLVVPKVSSERRYYAPIGWLNAPAIPSDLVFVCLNASLVTFALTTSAMHMAWLRQIGGRLKSDYRYSIGLVYNTFPWPTLTPADEARIGALAQGVLDARASWPESTLADLYDPDLMPPNLRKAHNALDLAVDRLYRKAPFTSERERVEHLFGLYEKMVAPIEAAAKAKVRKKKG
jgi:N-6 DNA Methylase